MALVTKKRPRGGSALMRRSMLLLSVFFPSRQNQVSGFSMVAPPTVTRSTLPSEWKTNTFHPFPIMEPETFDFAKSLLAKKEPSTIPALSSPLFRSKEKRQRSPQRTSSAASRIQKMTPSQLKSAMLRNVADFVVQEIEEVQVAKERKALLEDLETETFELNKTVRKVVDVQENLRYAWDAAGRSVIDLGLNDVRGLDLPIAKKSCNKVLHSFKNDGNLFDLITYSTSTKQTAKIVV
jgi:hypothetical protein